MNLIGNKEQGQLSAIQDPFKKDKIDGITIRMATKLRGGFYWYARVDFKNGNTSGERCTNNCDTYEQVYIELKQILESI